MFKIDVDYKLILFFADSGNFLQGSTARTMRWMMRRRWTTHLSSSPACQRTRANSAVGESKLQILYLDHERSGLQIKYISRPWELWVIDYVSRPWDLRVTEYVSGPWEKRFTD